RKRDEAFLMHAVNGTDNAIPGALAFNVTDESSLGPCIATIKRDQRA
ncbi:hypothetical protein Tco_0712995, partial [Tanacetum coccineum]